jgi:methylmalonyl-CoA/ethylmalonyl-CoA epimerase
MIGRLNHVAIAVPKLAEAAALYANALGAKVSQPAPHPEHGVTVVFVTLPIIAARDQLKAQGARVLGDGNPKIGAHGKPVLFLHPKDFNGTLIEIEQA